MRHSISEWPTEKVKSVRTALFIARCALIWASPRLGYLIGDNGGNTEFGYVSPHQKQVTLIFELIAFSFYFFELFIRLKTRKTAKEPVFRKWWIMFFVLSLPFFFCFLLMPVVFGDYRAFGELTFLGLGYFMWPYAAILLIDLTASLIIWQINRSVFPRENVSDSSAVPIPGWPVNKVKKVRTRLFIVRCGLVLYLPWIVALLLNINAESNLSLVENDQIRVFLGVGVWSLICICFLAFESFICLKTRKTLKEPVVRKFWIFAAVLSPLFLYCLILIPLFYAFHSTAEYEPYLYFSSRLPLEAGVEAYKQFSYFLLPRTIILLYELILAIVISIKNRTAFPKKKKGYATPVRSDVSSAVNNDME